MTMATSRRSHRSAALLALGAAALVLASCGGSRDGDERSGAAARAGDPDALAERAAGPNRAARSGRIDGRIDIDLQGVAAFAEPFSVDVRGPFRHRRGASLPDYELEMGVGDNGIGLTALRGRSWVGLGSTGYPLPAPIRRRLVRSSARGENGLTRTLEQFGIAPSRWETDRRIAGTTRLDGVEVAHITTSFNAGRLVRDANTLLGLLSALGITRATGLPDRISRRARHAVVRSVTLKRGASWIGVRDKVLRRARFTMKFAVARADRAVLSGISGGTIAGELNVTGIGTPQRVRAPARTGPFANFRVAVDALADQRAARGR
ncbi:MAG TPA: hypothetical protein VG474_00275 [Solirubrobacteraceae bacterium]|nr:hypothetical protein [Solirubrobacteraceae bacterium]